jgi:hypothetical protein
MLVMTGTAESGRTPLHIASFCGRYEFVRLLVERHGANHSAKDSDGRTPMNHYEEGKTKVQLQLLAQNVTPLAIWPRERVSVQVQWNYRSKNPDQ